MGWISNNGGISGSGGTSGGSGGGGSSSLGGIVTTTGGTATAALKLSGGTWYDGTTPGVVFGNAASLAGYGDGATGVLQVRSPDGSSNFPLAAQWVYASGIDANSDALIAVGGNVRAGPNKDFRFGTTSSRIRDSGNGIITLLNNAASGFSRLCFGGATASEAAIKYLGSGLGLALRNAADTGYMPWATGAATVNGNASVTGSMTAATAGVTGDATVGGGLTVTGSVTANNIVLPGGAVSASNISAIGAGDVAAATGGAYYGVWHMDSAASTNYGSSVSGTGNYGGGGSYIHANEDMGVPIPDVSVASHPGVMYVGTKAVGYASVYYQAMYIFAPNQGVTTQIRILFRPPTVASDATNDYGYWVGAINASSGNMARGWYIRYRHSQNSGNWVISAINSANSGETGTVNTSVAPVFGVWQTLILSFPPSGTAVSLSLTVNGSTTALGSITNTDMNAPSGNAFTQVCGHQLYRYATDGTTNRTAYIDRCSIYSTGMVTGG